MRLADHDHPKVQSAAKALTDGAKGDAEKLERIVQFVRDDILFGFPAKGDFVPASETLRTGVGQCNTKGTLVLALCRAAGLEARIHFSLISKEIQKGFFTGPSYWVLPGKLSHSWVEVRIGSDWKAVDSFINDKPLHDEAVKELAKRGWNTGFSVSLDESDEGFEQMNAVTDDQGIWQDPSNYYESEFYRNLPVKPDNWFYQQVLQLANSKVKHLRDRHRIAG